MKNIYPKSKGKIHPSPAPPSASGAGGGEALSVLKLLPAAIFALTAALAFEDKEVVAYLMIRSINGTAPAADAAEDRRRCRRTGGVHRPLFDCGCFGCYTCFWSRWDCSKDRETIHTVVEAFEEHLASKERRKGKEAKRRKKKKKCKDEKREEEAAAVMERESDEKMAEISAAEENKGLEEGAVIVSEGCLAEEAAAAAADGEVVEAVESPAVSRGERRGWADVMGIFNSRLWSLWNPGV